MDDIGEPLVTEFNYHSGELIERMEGLLLNGPAGDPDWAYNISIYCSLWIGGSDVVAHHPRPATDYAPGTAGYELSQRYDLVSAEEYVRMIGRRMAELVERGLSEPFIVRALRNELSRTIERLTDVGTASTSRQQIVEDLGNLKSSPERLQRYRETLARLDPAEADISDEELIRALSRFQRRLDPPDIDEASNKWAMVEHWRARSERLLSDELIEEWEQTMNLRAY